MPEARGGDQRSGTKSKPDVVRIVVWGVLALLLLPLALFFVTRVMWPRIQDSFTMRVEELEQEQLERDRLERERTEQQQTP